MTIRFRTAALAALAFVAAAAAGAHADSPTDQPVRIAFAANLFGTEAKPNNTLVKRVAKGIQKTLGTPVQIASPADADAVVVEVTTDPPGQLGASTWMRAKVDGRALNVRLPSAYPRPYEHWEWAADQLGRDIGLVLKLRTEAGGPVQVEALIAQLGDRDPATRARAAHLVGRLGPQARAAVPALQAILDDWRPLHTVGTGSWTTAGREAAKALAYLGAHAELIAFFRSPADDDARAEALQYIAIGRSPGSAEIVLQALDDRSRKVRTRAAGLAGAYVGRRAVPRLIEIVDQVLHGDMREAARRSLTQLAGKDLKQDAAAWRQWWAAQQAGR